jgi:hypothetical protein
MMPNERLREDAKGHDIVGLKPGQKFDPLGDMNRQLAEILAKEAEATGTLPATPSSSPPDENDPQDR